MITTELQAPDFGQAHKEFGAQSLLNRDSIVTKQHENKL